MLIGDYLDNLQKLQGEKFDIVFLDPPFDSDFGIKSIEYLSNNRVIVAKSALGPNIQKMISR